ncbi:hypothetical protein ACHAXA_001880 [Cyclostephanos tholiformis]|uniref:Crinkler (CRN) family protein n=1 Tax=Cyclostephanos tholiformis TaxID=382380 RepID=A0ABD3RQV9_9STRA
MSSNLQQWSSTSHPPSPLIWFLLLDSVTGQPYKGTTADYVSIYSGAVVAEFRKLVHRENSNKLANIDASDLLIYENKAAFDNRSTADSEGKVDPLDPTQSVGGLGSMEDMLVVAVPPPPIQPSLQIRQPSSFPPCSEKFFNSIFNATEIDDGSWILFEQKMPETTLNQLFIRKSYKTIASSILEGNGNKAIITGTPGIGKSLFLFYLLWKLVKDGKRVLFMYGTFNIYYDGNGAVFWFASGNLPQDNDVSFWNHSLWCLFDAKRKGEADLNHLPQELSTFIISTSPRRDMVNDFKKPPVPQIFYMPIWTEAELDTITLLFPHATQWRERFEILGGIPRHVLEDTTQSPLLMLDAACADCSLNDCIKKIGINSTITDKSKVIHSLVHMTSDPPFTNSSVCYASPTALNIIVKYMGDEAKHRMRTLLASCEGNPLTAALCGYIFEPYAIELLERGGTFPCRQLVHGNNKIKPNDTTLYIPRSKKIVVDRVLPDQTVNKLHVPKTKNYAAIDAWIPGTGAFQMTVGKKHDINSKAEDDLAMLGEANRLYWLLPPLYYHSFTKKKPQDIEQYAIMVPYPE